MGAAAAGLLTSQAFSRDQPSCETLATIPLVPQPVIILPKKPTQEKVSSSLWSYFQSSYDWFLNLFQLLKRLTFFSLYFTPTVLTSPILLISSPSLELKWWQLVRWSIFSCGPCLTKFSQWAATRPDIFPTRFCKELELLQAKSYEHSWDETVQIFNEIYGPQWSEVLALDRESTSGSGLVAQVYHGYLVSQKNSSLGKNKDKDLSQQRRHEVAVKILHPHVRDAMKEDLRLLSFLAQSLETSVSYLTYWYYSIPFLHPALASASVDPSNAAAEVNRASFLDTTISLMDIVREFDSFMTPQLDLRNEVIAMRRFHRNFREGYWKSHVDFAEPIEFPLPILQNASRESIVFDGDSDVYQKYSSEILLETFLEGIPMAQYLTERSQMRNDEKLQSQQRKFDKDIAGLGLDIILKMVSTTLLPPFPLPFPSLPVFCCIIPFSCLCVFPLFLCPHSFLPISVLFLTVASLFCPLPSSPPLRYPAVLCPLDL
jgi:predicted unusual protein kinase regulating ubiquinone biosynthesis (AarF/ABC1/UbiB family)